MATAQTNLLTAGNIAKELALPPAKVKSAIAALGLKPKVKKGGCSYYGAESLPKIKAAAR